MQDGPTSDLARAGLVVGGKFRLDACIGQGGMGSVWSATHLGLGNRIAIKLVSREFVQSTEALRRFDAEAKAAARLQSRHVVQVYDNGTLEDGTPYIAMELLTGESLQQRIDRSGPLPIEETVAILAQCCKALGRAHSVGIIHRDIKPDNIYLSRSPDDDSYIVKVLDFGVAKITMTGSGDQSSTKTGAVLGTPLYMSPEQARGLKNIDHRSDLYSLGIVAYTMITGRIAFYGESFGDILIKICTEPIPTLRISANVPPSLDSWLQRVCARDPARRCASAQEFIDTLRAAVGARAPISAAIGAPLSGQKPSETAIADSDAPWRLPPAVQSVAETSVAMSAGVSRARGRKANVAVAVSAIGGVALSVGVAFFAVSMRRSTPRSTESAHVAAAGAPQANTPGPTPPAAPQAIAPGPAPSAAPQAIAPGPTPPAAVQAVAPATAPAASAAQLAPLAANPTPSAAAAPARPPIPPAAARHAAPPPLAAHPPTPHAAPQAPPSPTASKPPNSVDLGY